jgi:hypothetical protein
MLVKELFTTIASLALGLTFVHAQGYVEFYGLAADITTNSATYGSGQSMSPSGKIVGGGTYDFALLYATSTTADDSSPLGADWNPVTEYGGATLSFNILPGYSGSLVGPGTLFGNQVDLASGTTYDVMLVGWTSELGSSWSVVKSELADGFGNVTVPAFFGNTGISTMTPSSTFGPGTPTLFPHGSLKVVFPNGSLVLYSVAPEPTTLALAGIGGLSLLLFRRQRK